MLSELTPNLLSRENFHPYPTAAERAAWQGLPDELQARLLQQGEEYLGYAWPFLPATGYMDYWRTGDRARYEKPYFARRTALGSLVLAECVEGQGRFLDEIITGLWAICEESSWVGTAHNHVEGRGSGVLLPDTTIPYIDLFAAETGMLLAWVNYLLRPQLDAVTPLAGERIEREVQFRIIEPYLTRSFPWMGDDGGWVNNWNPWCNSNCLGATLLLDADPARRAQAAAVCLRTLQTFLGIYHPDGGCDEGPSYWTQAGGALFDCLEWLRQATDGQYNLFSEPLIGEIGRYIMRMHVSGDYYVNFADGSARLAADGSLRVALPADLITRYGERIGDNGLQALGAATFHLTNEALPQAIWCSLTRILPAIFRWKEMHNRTATPPFLRDVWMPGVEVMTARETAGTDRGLYLAAKGGHNAESHNHNDIGQFVVYLDGRPIIVDPGVETYTRKTFSEQRYDIWTMQSAYHNLPTIHGVQQHEGGKFAAREVAYTTDERAASLTLDLCAAYPPEAHVARWQRTCRLPRGAAAMVEVVDDFCLEGPGEVAMHLLTCCTPEISAPGVLLLQEATGLQVRVTFEATLAPEIEYLPIDDARMSPVWGDHLYRITLKSTVPVQEGVWKMRVSRG